MSTKLPTPIFSFLFSLILLLSLTACGGGGPELGAFPAITKTEGDAPFALAAPASPSPGAFSYSSSNPQVAVVSGNMVTIVAAGTTTITATQEEHGSYRSSSISAVLTVLPRTCTAPAVRQNGLCVAPAVTGNTITRNGRTWSPVSFIGTWAEANSYCTTTTINGTTGWRLPTEFELSELFTSGAAAGQGWILSKTWSSTLATAATTTTTSQSSTTTTTASTTTTTVATAASQRRRTVRLDTGVTGDELETEAAYVACIR